MTKKVYDFDKFKVVVTEGRFQLCSDAKNFVIFEDINFIPYAISIPKKTLLKLVTKHALKELCPND